MKQISFLLFACCFSLTAVSEHKLLICGICKNVEFAIPNSINNIETLGSRFSDYAVIIYENNSRDKTPALLSKWARTNPRVKFISEVIPKIQLKTREENIANARNKVLSAARDYQDFKYLVMVDLDFKTPWPIDEIVKTIELPFDWDCISANGIINRDNYIYWDRYAFRDASCPFGPELLGEDWWAEQNSFPLVCPLRENFIPVYSAFGGLAIYKTETITKFVYSGRVTDDLTDHYQEIYRNGDRSNKHIKKYLDLHALDQTLPEIPIIYESELCCEHVTLHASMAKNGFDKIYISTKMLMVYNLKPKEFWRVKKLN